MTSRRRPIGRVSDQLGGESAARKGPDISHRIGFAILVIAALLIAIGAVAAPDRSGRASPGSEAGFVVAGDAQGQRR